MKSGDHYFNYSGCELPWWLAQLQTLSSSSHLPPPNPKWVTEIFGTKAMAHMQYSTESKFYNLKYYYCALLYPKTK